MPHPRYSEGRRKKANEEKDRAGMVDLLEE